MATQTFVEEMTKLLLAEKARLTSDVARFHAPDETERGTEDETASATTQRGDDLSLEDELEHGLRDIDSALKLIEKGQYGICKYCKQPIDERRLRARPMSTSCIECKKTLTQEM